MVQNPKYWRAKECDKTPLGNVSKEKSHFSSNCVKFGVWHILLLSNILDIVPCDLQLQRAYWIAFLLCQLIKTLSSTYLACVYWL